jgi:hypothetical protein
MDGNNVWMAELRGRSGLLQELVSFDPLDPARQFNGDVPAELVIVGFPPGPKAALADFLEDFEMADLGELRLVRSGGVDQPNSQTA